jgi:hypothetical protein
MMRVPLVEAVIAEIETYPGTTVADLLDFMRRFNLRFSPAEAPSERQLYKALYGLLVRQRELLTLNGNAADPPPPEPAATPP